MSEKDRFGGIDRLYGMGAAELLAHCHIMVIGIGGVGSWTAEALARSGVGKLTLIDADDVCVTNINRQIVALDDTVGDAKIDVMNDRIARINPDCEVVLHHEFVTLDNIPELVQDCDIVVDAIDAQMIKAAIIAHCKRQKIRCVTVGSAGGKTDPRLVTSGDLAKTKNDPLAAKVRGTLRNRFGFTRTEGKRFGVECVYSTEQMAYPQPDGTVNGRKYIDDGITKMDCSAGFGSITMVTATFGMVSATRAIDIYLAKHRN